MLRRTREPKVSKRHVAAWRNRTAQRLTAGGEDAESASALVVRFERALRRIDRLVDATYGSPDLGNFADPTAEFVYIVLSRKTAERAYRSTFARLHRLGTWAEVARWSPARLARALHGCGLERKKARAIREGLRLIRRTLGAFDLSRANVLNDDALYKLLLALPEVGPKSALCIMLYAFARPTFPVDAHVGRVLGRIGVLETVVKGLAGMDHKAKQRELADIVPPDLRYRLHVNLVSHGREVCRAANPRCAECPLRSMCQTAPRAR